jgi:hypothetical protein
MPENIFEAISEHGIFSAQQRKKQQYHEWQVGVIMVSAVGTQILPFERAWRDFTGGRC